MSKKKIALVNAWGSNRGDEAMVSALLCDWVNWPTPPDVDIFCNESLDIDRFHIQTLPALKISACTHRYRRRLSYILAALRMIAGQAACKHLAFNLIDADIVVSCPAGPAVGDLYPLTVELDTLLPLQLARTLRIPYGLLATSAGPFDRPIRNLIRRRALRRASFWATRENISYQHVKNFDFNSLPISKGADVVFTHPNREHKHFVPKSQRGEFNGILNDFQQTSAIIVALNTTAYLKHGQPAIPFDAKAYGDQMCKLLDEVVKHTDSHVWIAPHFYGSKNEMALCRHILSNCKFRDNIRIVNPDFNAEMQMALYAKADFAISHRYHPTIFSAKACTPFLCIRHQFKVEGMLEMFDNPGPVVRTSDPVERWIEAFFDAWDCRQVIADQIRAKLPFVTNSAFSHLEIVRKLCLPVR